MAQSKKTKSTILAADEVKSSRWVIHEKLKDHAQKVKTHVKKHHKKYVWWFFAWFAIAKTAKVVAAAIWLVTWSLFITAHTPLHEVLWKDVDYSSCVFEQQFCFDLAVSHNWEKSQIENCVESGGNMIIAYKNNEINDEKFLTWLKGLWLDSIEEFLKSYDTYASFMCECCDGDELWKWCCDAKYDNCIKVYDWKYKEYCTDLKKWCEGEICKKETREQKCDETTLPENAKPTNPIFMQTWNGEDWEPKEMKWTYDGKECGFVCVDDYTWNKEKGVCEKIQQQEQKCDESLLPKNTKPTNPTFTQTWNGKEWEPAEISWTYNGKECGFVCVDGYAWNEKNWLCEEKISYDSCVFEEQFCVDLARANGWSESQVNLCINSGEEIVWYINNETNKDIVSKFLGNFKWLSSDTFVALYNKYQGNGQICSCCNGEEWQDKCCDAKEWNCTVWSKGEDYDWYCVQLKSAHSRGEGGACCPEEIAMSCGNNWWYYDESNCSCVIGDQTICIAEMIDTMNNYLVNTGWAYTPWLIFSGGMCIPNHSGGNQCGLDDTKCNSIGMAFDEESCSCGVTWVNQTLCQNSNMPSNCESIDTIWSTHFVDNGLWMCACTYEYNPALNQVSCSTLMFDIMKSSFPYGGYAYVPWLVLNDGVCEKSCDCEQCGLNKVICNNLGMEFDQNTCSCSATQRMIESNPDLCHQVSQSCENIQWLSGITHYVGSDEMCACVYECNDGENPDNPRIRPNNEEIIDLVYSYMACKSPREMCPDLRVQRLQPNTLPNSLSGNTIYIVSGEKVYLGEKIHMPDCTAIISNPINWRDVTFHLEGEEPFVIDMEWKCTVLYNVSVKWHKGQNWIYVYSWEGKTLSLVKVYNAWNGIVLGYGSQFLLNNIQTYNNSWNGISIDWLDSVSINNLQSYKNGVWLAIKTSRNIINNAVLYGNARGLQIDNNATSNKFNNLKIYRNWNYNRIDGPVNGSNKYYGILRLEHESDNQICGGSVSETWNRCRCANDNLLGNCRTGSNNQYTLDECAEICSMHRGPRSGEYLHSCDVPVSAGTCNVILSTGISLYPFADWTIWWISASDSNFTNPADGDWYLYNWWNIGSTNNFGMAVKYSYGENIPRQELPYTNLWTTSQTVWTDTTKYIWSNVLSVAWNIWFTKTYINKILYEWIWTTTVTDKIKYYSILWLASTWADTQYNTWFNRNINVENVYLHLRAGRNKFVMQVFNAVGSIGIYFATHKYDAIEVKRPQILLSPWQCMNTGHFTVNGTWISNTVYQSMPDFEDTDITASNGLTVSSFAHPNTLGYTWVVDFPGMYGSFSIGDSVAHDQANIPNVSKSTTYYNVSIWHPTTSIISPNLDVWHNVNSSGKVIVIFNTNDNPCKFNRFDNMTWICDYESWSTLCTLCNTVWDTGAVVGNYPGCTATGRIMRYELSCPDGHVCLKKVRYNSYSRNKDNAGNQYINWEVNTWWNWTYGTWKESLVKIDRAAPIISWNKEILNNGNRFNVIISDITWQNNTWAWLQQISYSFINDAYSCNNNVSSWNNMDVDWGEYSGDVEITDVNYKWYWLCIRATDKVWNVSYKNLGLIYWVSCLSWWDNDNFLNDWFRNNYSGDNELWHDQVKCALYGAWQNDPTAYTVWWNNYNCDVYSISVVETWNLGPSVPSHGIIVLNTGVVYHWHIDMNPCSAIVSKNTGFTNVIFSSSDQQAYPFINWNFNSILDNIIINLDNYSRPTAWLLMSWDMTVNRLWVLNGLNWIEIKWTYNVLNNVHSYNNSENWIYVRWNKNVLNNILSYNNNWFWIRISSASNIINNWSINNNAKNWIDIRWQSNVLNNIQAYNNSWYAINSDYDVYLYWTSSFRWNNFTTLSNNIKTWVEYPLLNWTTWLIINEVGSMYCDHDCIIYFSNPRVKGDGYLIDTWWSYEYIHKWKINWFSWIVNWYSYGVNLLKQWQPVMYSGNTPIRSWSYYSGGDWYYVWWNTPYSSYKTYYNDSYVYVVYDGWAPMTKFSLMETPSYIYNIWTFWYTPYQFEHYIQDESIRVTQVFSENNFATHYNTLYKDNVWPSVSATNAWLSCKTWSINAVLSVWDQPSYSEYNWIVYDAIWLSWAKYYWSTWEKTFNNCRASGVPYVSWMVVTQTSTGQWILYLCAYDILGNTWFWTGSYCLTWEKTSISCLQSSQWNNDNFLTGRFWSLNPSDDNIICALYGTGENDTTAYTVWWRWWQWWRSCDVLRMAVERVSWLPSNLSGNTIYVLDVWSTILSDYQKMWDCTAIVSKSGTILYTNHYISTSMIEMRWQFSILDNLSIDGINYRVGYRHAINDIW